MRIRPARTWQRPDDPGKLIADRAIPKLRSAFRTALGNSRKSFATGEATRLLNAGHFGQIAGLVDWMHGAEVLRRPLGLLGDVWTDAGELGERKINGSFAARRRQVRYGSHHHGLRKDAADFYAFDRFSPATQAAIRAYQDAFITQMSAEARKVIEQVVLAGQREGLTAAEVAQRIRNAIGLNAPQAMALSRYRQSLIDQLTPDELAALAVEGASPRVDALVDAYYDRQLAYRADMIARTESTRAASMGLLDSYRQAIDRGVLPEAAVTKFWRVSLAENTCPICLGIADRYPNGLPLGEKFVSSHGAFDGPPSHPQCRCSISLVTDLDMVAAA